ncbi:MAG: hypothetical protein A3B37_01850 [Candidatus Sungbacteria bacterium RIFCSPLOWO2_01_FULL_59_16]|uniref:Uncharacterized protein n=1 Tax=Candidatus Sungbacteria bacterium RIFCSPLOWO2_01_FULL_59_16 TaxID=1802280 RepID=A0A1G2LAJ2_9BACT|nr:MAG: hypothetical protein A3B37_01850 [Candidatus Sungbacteria bacterium RIFCSPLOWO2_01_FULL_59_16]
MTTANFLAPRLELKRRIMRRVYGIWFWKSVAPLLAVEAVLVVGVAVGVLTHISVRQILLNAFQASDGAAAFAQFFIDNFFVKSIQSQLLVAVWAVLLAFFVRDARHALRRRSADIADFMSLVAAGNRQREHSV